MKKALSTVTHLKTVRYLTMDNKNQVNGWMNRATYRVASALANDEFVYNIALKSKDFNDYRRNLRAFAGIDELDTISLWNKDLDINSLTEAIKELKND